MPSLNAATPVNKCLVQYPDMDRAIETCLALDLWENQGDGTIYYSKTDVQSAFRILPLNKNSYKWLLMKATNPVNGKTYYFVEKCLPFGASISCAHFQRFSNALRHIFEKKTGSVMIVTNYLDDFLFVVNTKEKCDKLVRRFLKICDRLGVPIAKEKTEWGATKMVFLGLLLDGVNRLVTVPQEKVVKVTNWLNHMVSKRQARVKELQGLAGLLNFITRAIVPGRAFTRRMCAKFSDKLEVLKPYRHITLDREFKEDCRVWLQFLSDKQRLGIS